MDQFRNYEEIRNILQSLLRGEGKYSRSVLFTYNPPKSSRSWVNQEVKLTREDRMVHHSTYLDVPEEWLGETFITEAKHLKEVNEQAYRHEYLGEEVGTGLEVFTNVSLRAITDEEINNFDKIRQGIDFGFSVDPASVTRMYFDSTRKRLYIFGEIYGINIFNDQLADMIKNKGWNDVMTIADSAEPKSVADLARHGIRIVGAKKGPGSIEHGIKFLQGLEAIIIDDVRCPNVAKEFMNYALDVDSRGFVKTNFPDKDNHCLTGDTIVNTCDGDIPIKDLVSKKGKVYCYDEINQEATISEYFDVRLTQKNIDVYEIKMNDGRVIKATDYHPILTQRGWVNVKDLTVEDKVLDIANYIVNDCLQQTNIVKQKHVQEVVVTDLEKFVKIKSIKYIGKQDVYNMEVKDHHNFSVNGGLIVHNCIDGVRYGLQNDMTVSRPTTFNKRLLGL